MLKMDFKQLFESGILEKVFQRAKYSEGEDSYRINLYVTGITACPCRCKFCRNTEIKSTCTKFNTEAFKQMYEKYGRLIRMITFGGGEPLLYFDQIMDLVNSRNISYSGRAIITSGIKSEFMKCAKKFRSDYSAKGYSYEHHLEMDSFLDMIYLSRHHANDMVNQLSFGTKEPLLTRDEIRLLPAGIVNKMAVVTTCYKNGGTSTVEEMQRMVNWTIVSTIPTIVFNNLQKSMTDAQFYKAHQVDDDLFDKFIASLTELSDDFHLKNQIVFSGGYTVKTYSSERLRLKIGFKKYHKTLEETRREWEKATKRTFDLTMEPNGTIYLDRL